MRAGAALLERRGLSCNSASRKCKRERRKEGKKGGAKLAPHGRSRTWFLRRSAFVPPFASGSYPSSVKDYFLDLVTPGTLDSQAPCALRAAAMHSPSEGSSAPEQRQVEHFREFYQSSRKGKASVDEVVEAPNREAKRMRSDDRCVRGGPGAL